MIRDLEYKVRGMFFSAFNLEKSQFKKLLFLFVVITFN